MYLRNCRSHLEDVNLLQWIQPSPHFVTTLDKPAEQISSNSPHLIEMLTVLSLLWSFTRRMSGESFTFGSLSWISKFSFLIHWGIPIKSPSHTHVYVIAFVQSPFEMIVYATVTSSFPPLKPLILKRLRKNKPKPHPLANTHQSNCPTHWQPQTFTCRGNKVLLLLSVRNMFSSIQDLGPTDPPERGNLGGAMTLLEKGFFRGEAWLTEPGMPMPLPLRWSRPQDIPPEPQPFAWWPPQGDGFTMGCTQIKGGGGTQRGKMEG